MTPEDDPDVLQMKLTAAGYFHREAMGNVLDVDEEQDMLEAQQDLEARRKRTGTTSSFPVSSFNASRAIDRTGDADDADVALALQKAAVSIALYDSDGEVDDSDYQNDDYSQPYAKNKHRPPDDFALGPTIAPRIAHGAAANAARLPPRSIYSAPNRPGAFSISGTRVTTANRRCPGDLIFSDGARPIPNIEETRNNEASEPAQDPTHSDPSSTLKNYNNNNKRRTWAVVATLSVIGTAIGAGVGVLVAGRNKSQKRPSDEPQQLLGLLVPEVERILLHCSTGNATNLTKELLLPFSEFERATFSQSVPVISQVNLPSLDSCLPENLALLYLMNEFRDIEQGMDVGFLNTITNTYVLALLFISWEGLGWVENKNWLASSSWYCDWYGVECNEQDEVISLQLKRNGVKGTIPPQLGLLTSLRQLRLDGVAPSSIDATDAVAKAGFFTETSEGGALSGGLPTELFRLTNLKYLSLAENALTGSLSSNLGLLTKLVILSVGNNKLVGQVPSMANLQDLEFLNLSNNGFTGSLPADMGQSTKLIAISLLNNKLTGTIPFSFEKLQFTLIDIDLESNGFTGTIPTEVGLCSDLRSLGLGSNLFEGTIPTQIGLLTELQLFSAYDTSLEGVVSDQICLLRVDGSLVDFRVACDGMNDSSYASSKPVLVCSIPDCCTGTAYGCTGIYN
jgi:Leucine-rich repeat (LRR) protein